MRALLERVTHWKTTAAGLAISGGVLYVARSLGCQMPADWITWAVTIAPGLLGVLAKDH